MRSTLIALALATTTLLTGGCATADPVAEVTVDPERVSAQCWFDLLDAGYTGHPDDHTEALHVPASELSRLCGVTL